MSKGCAGGRAKVASASSCPLRGRKVHEGVWPSAVKVAATAIVGGASALIASVKPRHVQTSKVRCWPARVSRTTLSQKLPDERASQATVLLRSHATRGMFRSNASFPAVLLGKGSFSTAKSSCMADMLRRGAKWLQGRLEKTAAADKLQERLQNEPTCHCICTKNTKSLLLAVTVASQTHCNFFENAIESLFFLRSKLVATVASVFVARAAELSVRSQRSGHSPVHGSLWCCPMSKQDLGDTLKTSYVTVGCSCEDKVLGT